MVEGVGHKVGSDRLDSSIRRYNENLEKLKMEDFVMRKKIQDDVA